MKKILMPDYMFEKYDDITPDFLENIGVRALIIDIDNTLAPYEQAEPDERLFAWVRAMREHGIGMTLMSNNDRERVELFNRELKLPAYYKSGKPLGKNLKRAMTDMGSDKTDTAVLGDQLLTDALAGNLLGLRAIIVPPIKDKTSLFFRFKRLCERPTVKKFKKRNGIDW
ncbi:MAG: YqeG family HAD IIIA-type phosphatase [Clostridia bacterium]|nr:YqeG family HAD IIIA-type phosphatase [Clostridia bacterium]